MIDILVAEDDADIREWVAYTLEQNHYRVRRAANGVEALSVYEERRPDLLILDLMMPKKTGWDVCLDIRKRDKAVPIMMLTARSTEADKIQGLGLGADDYMTKPFSIRELLARVAALLRRSNVMGEPPPNGGEFAFGTLQVNGLCRTLRFPNCQTADLTELELGVLRYLVAHPNEVVTRDSLLNGVWGIAYTGSTRTLDTRIASLRKKLGTEAGKIETVHGSGYRYRP